MPGELELHGILPAVVTPFDPVSGNIDEGALEAVVRRQVQAGCGGVVTCGSTGEYVRLTGAERCRVLEIAVGAAAGAVPVIAQTGALTTAEAIELSQHAQETGAAAVMVAPPYYEPLNGRELLSHFRAVADAVHVPIIYYHIPGATGQHLTVAQVSEIAAIDGIGFIKDSTGNATQLTEVLEQAPGGVRVLNGWDGLTLYGFVAGAPATIWGAATFMPELAVELYTAVAVDGDLGAARKIWSRIWPVIELLENCDCYVSAVKAGCELSGLQTGPPRRPGLPVSAQFRAELATRMADAGLEVLEGGR